MSCKGEPSLIAIIIELSRKPLWAHVEVCLAAMIKPAILTGVDHEELNGGPVWRLDQVGQLAGQAASEGQIVASNPRTHGLRLQLELFLQFMVVNGRDLAPGGMGDNRGGDTCADSRTHSWTYLPLFVSTM